MALNPFGVLGVPGGIGGAALGLGIVISLNDMFSKQANQITKAIRTLDDETGQRAANMTANLNRMNAALAITGAGIVGLAALSLPVREAVKFEEAIRRVQVIADDIDPKVLSDMVIDLSMMFPEGPIEMAEALKTTVAAGITDVEKAMRLLKSTNKLAIATQSNLERSIEGMTSVVNAYQLGLDESTSPEAAEQMYDTAASQIFEAMKIGKFSDVSGITDFEAMAKQMGQLLPTATTAMNMSFGELLSVWAASTLSGQNARRSATGLRQAFMDILNRSRDPDSLDPAFVSQLLKNTGYNAGARGELQRFVRERGFTSLLTEIREFAGITDPAGVAALLETPKFQAQMDEIMSTLPEDMSVAEAMATSDTARELMESLKDAGGVDPSRVNQLFRSIWGLTAILPLITTQYDRIIETGGKLAESTDTINAAFNAVMDTVVMQWRLLGSKLSTVNIMLGTALLTPIKNAMRFLNLLVDGILAVIKHAPLLAEVFMHMASGVSIFLAFTGISMAARVGLKLFNEQFMLLAGNVGVFSRWAKGGIIMAFKDIAALIFVLITASYLLRKAWQSDLFQIRTVSTAWFNNTKLVFEAITTLFRNLREHGIAFIGEDLYRELEAAGLVEFTGTLFALLYRLDLFMQGFAKGFKSFFTSLYDALRVARDGLYDVLGPTIENIAWLDNLLSGLFERTQENADAWAVWGERLGRVAAALTLIGGSLWILKNLGRLLAFVTFGMSGMLKPMGLWLFHLAKAHPLLLAVSVAAAFFWDDLVAGGQAALEWVRVNLPAIGRFIDRLGNVIFFLPDQIKRLGVRDALIWAFEGLFQLDWDAFNARLSGALSQARQTVANFATSARAKWDELWTGLDLEGKSQRFLAMWERVKQGAISLFEGLKKMILPLWDSLVNGISWGDHWTSLTNIVRLAADIIMSIFDLLSKSWEAITSWFNSIGSGYWQGFWDRVAAIADLALTTVLGILEIGLGLVSNLLKLANGEISWRQAWDNMIVILEGFKDRLIEKLTRVFTDVVEYVKNKFTSLWAAFVDAMPAALRDLLGIQAPAPPPVSVIETAQQEVYDRANPAPMAVSPVGSADGISNAGRDLANSAVNNPMVQAAYDAITSPTSQGGVIINDGERELLTRAIAEALNIPPAQITVELDGRVIAQVVHEFDRREAQRGAR